MSINLSDLTSANNQDVLAEITSGADFLDPIGKLKNLSRSPNKGTHALQTVALNQPKALPLIDGDGYLYLSGVSGNHASIPNESSFNLGTELEIRCKVTCKNWTPGTNQLLVAKSSSYSTSLTSFYLELSSNGKLSIIYNDGSNVDFAPSTVVTGISDGSTKWIKATLNTNQSGSAVINYYLSDDNISYTQLGATVTKTARGDIHDTAHPITIGHGTNNFGGVLLGAVHQVQIFASNNGTSKILDVDFTATNVRHGDTKFKCATNQIVTINQDFSSSNDVATIIKKPVLRFDGANDFMKGVFGQTIDGGYMFAAFSVLGNGGNPSGRVFSINSTGITDSGSRSAIFSHTEGTKTNLQSFYNGTPLNIQSNLFDESNGDILHESLIKNGSQKAGVNNANFLNTSLSTSIESEEFSISCNPTAVDARNTAIDLEYLALFDATITDDQADSVRNFINNRKNVFSLVDGFGYYFFDPQKADFTGNFTGANTLDGYITGSDNGDTDVRSNLTLVQATQNDQPSTDGYTITFNDAAEHLEFENSASQNLSGWQIVGTSLGTFVYRVQGAVTELNLLGNAGTVRSIGDLYGIILLPASATGKDIEDARKLLIDRGAADAASVTSVEEFWRNRSDIVEFNHVNFTNVTNFLRAWRDANSINNFGAINAPNGNNFSGAWEGCDSLLSFPAGAKLGTSANNVNFTSTWQENGLTSFPALDLSKGINMSYAWYNATSLSSFGAIDARGCTNFFNAWNGCSSLTSFPAGAKLGTAASSGVNFNAAWQQSGLTSFSTPLPTATNLQAAFRYCTPLVSFTLNELPLVTSVSTTWQSTRFQSFSTKLPKVEIAYAAWYYNNALTDFSADVFANWNPSNIQNGVFNLTWTGCGGLTAQSVENILTSIDASGQYATSDGDAYVNGVNTQLADAGIDIDYNGTTLSAATNTAIESLRDTKGWSIFINGVEQT